jgi:hypothetical protein
MSAGTLYDTGAATIEVRIYSGDQLLMREFCESEDDAEGVVDRWSDPADLFVVADDLSAKHGPGDVVAPEPPIEATEEELTIASMPIPGLGTE